MYSLCNEESFSCSCFLPWVFLLQFYLREIPHSFATAFCEEGCRYGGTCVAPNKCVCPSGFTGSHCEKGNLPLFGGGRERENFKENGDSFCRRIVLWVDLRHYVSVLDETPQIVTFWLLPNRCPPSENRASFAPFNISKLARLNLSLL